MASASIESTVTAPVAKATVTDASRDDLEINDVVLLNSVNVGTDYSWTIAYSPEGSAASFSGSVVAQSPGSFTVDVDGSYLIRLMFTGLSGTTEQFVRLRALTAFGSLKLIAAGEAVSNIPVPVDITAAGWADEQNFNINTLLGFVKSVGASGRILYVDPLRGDYITIQAAIDFAQSQGPTSASQWAVLVRPSLYVEDLIFRPFVHVFGWPGGKRTNMVRVRNATTASQLFSLPTIGDETTVSEILFEQLSATANPLATISGVGRVTAFDCTFLVGGSDATQGATFRTASGTSLRAIRCRFIGSSTSGAATFALEAQSISTMILRECSVSERGLTMTEATVDMRDTALTSNGTYAVWGNGALLDVRYSQIEGDITFNQGGGALTHDVIGRFRWSTILGTLTYDVTGITGVTELTLSSTEHGVVTYTAAPPVTSGSTIPSSSLAYDNASSGLIAENVQAAIDEILVYASAVRTLDNAYNGGDPGITGSGRTIVAGAGSVRIVDASSPSDPIPAANTNGNLEVVGGVYVGALTKPEIGIDPNPYGAGPEIIMGWTILPSDAPSGATSTILGNSTGTPTFHNYNILLGTLSANGGGSVGRVMVRGGDSLEASTAAGHVYVSGGQGTLGGGGNGGDIVLAPGRSAGATEGFVKLIRGADGTAATLTAAGGFVGGVTGTIRFGTEMGAVEVDIDSGDLLAAVLTKLSANGQFTATDSGGGVILLTTTATGQLAQVFFLNTSTGLDTALGVFSGQAMVAGTWPSFILIEASAHQEITFGSGDPMPMIYNSSTGKLTVPGLIDPTGLILTEAPAPSTGAAEGGLFVSDGTGGLTQGELYFRKASDAVVGSPLSGGGGGSVPIPYHLNFVEDPGNTVQYRGWAYAACTCTKVRVYMATKNTVGTYILTVTNNATGNTMLDAATFDMNTLTNDTVTAMTLTGTPADLVFPDAGRWTVDLASNDAGFDGEGIYIELVFEAS